MAKKIKIRGFRFSKLKNIFYNLLIITLILNLSGSVSAAGVIEVSPPVNINNVSVNDFFNISVNISSAENMQGGTFDLWFNNSILNVTSAVKGSFMTCTTLGDQVKINNSAGRVHVAIFCCCGKTVNGEGQLATITFKAISYGSSNLSLGNAYIYNATADRMTTTVQNGSVNVSTLSLQYNLYKIQNSTGLNLISLPLAPSPPITTAEDLCGSIPNSETIYQWDPITQSYEGGHVCNTPFGNFDLSKVSGYSVAVSANTTWTLSGDIIPPVPIDLVKIPGSTGHNLIGLPYYSTLSPFTAEGLCQSIPHSETITQLNPITQSYEGHPCGTPIGNFDLSKGTSYLVSVSENTTWMPS